MLAGLREADGGMNTYYISYNKEMTETYVKDTAGWAKRLNIAAGEFEEVVLEDEKDILATGYASPPACGNGLVKQAQEPAVQERPHCHRRSGLLRGSGRTLEGGHRPDMWGGSVEVISTHNGETNPFNTISWTSGPESIRTACIGSRWTMPWARAVPPHLPGGGLLWSPEPRHPGVRA
ncbi:hypothetical protein [Desulfolutivibrio sulfodismutans]|uniref:hypothetical protein n=1 Tax=Desulfolutivibrio sulfodismutans TaxID=63561 RepID=UPI001FECC900|nr:hypothetical protein [Desulfolutivibrio sulfodismutans]